MKGIHNGRPKLNEDKVVEILKSNETCKNLASKYGVTPTTISNVRTHKFWKHVSIKKKYGIRLEELGPDMTNAAGIVDWFLKRSQIS